MGGCEKCLERETIPAHPGKINEMPKGENRGPRAFGARKRSKRAKTKKKGCSKEGHRKAKPVQWKKKPSTELTHYFPVTLVAEGTLIVKRQKKRRGKSQGSDGGA